MASHRELGLKEKSYFRGNPDAKVVCCFVVPISYALIKLSTVIYSRKLLDVGLKEGEIEENIRNVKVLAREIARLITKKTGFCRKAGNKANDTWGLPVALSLFI